MCIQNCIKSRLWPEKLIKDILEKVTNVKENTVPLKIAWAVSLSWCLKYAAMENWKYFTNQPVRAIYQILPFSFSSKTLSIICLCYEAKTLV